MLETLRFHHIGYAVKDIQTTATYYMEAGWSVTEETIDPIQNTRIAFLRKEGFPLIELVAPVNGESPVSNILQNIGNTPYHICYETDDIDDAIMRLTKKKYIPLFDPIEAAALDFCRICYLFNKNVGLIEVMEKRVKPHEILHF